MSAVCNRSLTSKRTDDPITALSETITKGISVKVPSKNTSTFIESLNARYLVFLVRLSSETLKIDSALVSGYDSVNACRSGSKETLCVTAYHLMIRACYRDAYTSNVERLEFYLLLQKCLIIHVLINRAREDFYHETRS